MAVLAFGSIISCQEKEPDTIPVEAVAISQSTAEMVIGDHIQLKALISPSNATEKDVIWSSSNQRVATVSEDGYVEALAKGTSNISALVGGLTAICRVSVSEVTIESLTLSKQSLQLFIGQSETVVATIKPDYTTDKTIIWSSADPTIATVEDGVVTGKKVGETTIKAKSGDIIAECAVVVTTKPVDSITLDKESIELGLYETLTLVATIQPDDATDKTVYWQSSNTRIVEVDNGKIWGVNVGTANITAYCGDKSANCRVTVSIPLVESVSFDKSSLDLLAGQEETLTASILPENANSWIIEWWSDNPEIATVYSKSLTGTVRGIKAGETNINAIAIAIDNYGNELQEWDEKIVASCKVKVTEIPAESITLNQTSLSMKPGDTFQLTATVYPDNVTNRTITWTSSNPSKISVSQNGLVTANDTGAATISVYCGGITVYCQVVSADTDGLCLEAIETGNVEIKNPLSRTIQYSYDGIMWESDNRSAFSLALNKGEKLFFRGNSANYSNSSSFASILCHGKCYVYGNIMSLISTNYRSLTSFTSTYALAGLFLNNNKIVNHPDKELLLPATKLSSYCYYRMFEGCVSLSFAPSLPASSLAQACYKNMFLGCSELKAAPTLPAVSLAYECYSSMFERCTNISEMPELPAKNLDNYCYDSMFEGCTALTTVSSLPGLTLAPYCYRDMFKSCTALTKAPSLPATTLASYCYSHMFDGCVAMQTAPSLPATTLSDYCYEGMFQYCTSLEVAPVLPAYYLSSCCYQYMFYGCSKLDYIKALFLDFNYYSTRYWVTAVSSSGTFIKNALNPNSYYGEDYIPYGWNVETANE